ncbi:hypothetical protein E2C01_000542 [Portunus trituberculatus]|uniref:Uncharacterized protein n=1 Tax=Portunus trituberculatus TaxID=210409 RepID=A0A5B7CGV0_PORTR|nr:hypothetical protein [Portunus trituberculatus]
MYLQPRWSQSSLIYTWPVLACLILPYAFLWPSLREPNSYNQVLHAAPVARWCPVQNGGRTPSPNTSRMLLHPLLTSRFPSLLSPAALPSPAARPDTTTTPLPSL